MIFICDIRVYITVNLVLNERFTCTTALWLRLFQQLAWILILYWCRQFISTPKASVLAVLQVSFLFPGACSLSPYRQMAAVSFCTSLRFRMATGASGQHKWLLFPAWFHCCLFQTHHSSSLIDDTAPQRRTDIKYMEGKERSCGGSGQCDVPNGEETKFR